VAGFRIEDLLDCPYVCPVDVPVITYVKCIIRITFPPYLLLEPSASRVSRSSR